MPIAIGAYSPERVIQAIEDNLVAASTLVGQVGDGVVFRGVDVTWVYTEQRPLSRVLKACFTPDRAASRVAEICDCFQSWKATVPWVVGPTSWPPDLPELLKSKGFDGGTHLAGLARSLPLDGVAPAIVPADIHMRRATTEQYLLLWGGPASGLALPRERGTGDGTVDRFAAEVFEAGAAGGGARCDFYLATVGGRPVARGLAFHVGEVAGLHWFEVEPGFERHDLGTALMRRALADAASEGAQLAVIVAGSDFQPLRREFGFLPYRQFSVYS